MVAGNVFASSKVLGGYLSVRGIALRHFVSYGRKHLVLLALAAGLVAGHPLASASCVVNMTSAATTDTNPNAITNAMKIMAFISMGGLSIFLYLRWLQYLTYIISLLLLVNVELLYCR
jgi:hypothetical protein